VRFEAVATAPGASFEAGGAVGADLGFSKEILGLVERLGCGVDTAGDPASLRVSG
jgi:hypothetical protein